WKLVNNVLSTFGFGCEPVYTPARFFSASVTSACVASSSAKTRTASSCTTIIALQESVVLFSDAKSSSVTSLDNLLNNDLSTVSEGSVSSNPAYVATKCFNAASTSSCVALSFAKTFVALSNASTNAFHVASVYTSASSSLSLIKSLCFANNDLSTAVGT